MKDSAVIHVVDDDASFRTAMERLLRAAGYQAIAYESVSNFLASFEGSDPGCIVVDLRMPEQTGLDLQKSLLKSENPIPIIFLTAYGDIPTTVRAMREGAIDFLTKPVKKEILFEAVERALARDTAAREQCARINELQARYKSLTPREREVLTHVIAGKLNKQIGFDLGTTERTIKAHRAKIMEKLRIASLAELVRLAQALKIQPAG
jgi:FixJ family two-component response regulator